MYLDEIFLSNKGMILKNKVLVRLYRNQSSQEIKIGLRSFSIIQDIRKRQKLASLLKLLLSQPETPKWKKMDRQN